MSSIARTYLCLLVAIELNLVTVTGAERGEGVVEVSSLLVHSVQVEPTDIAKVPIRGQTIVRDSVLLEDSAGSLLLYLIWKAPFRYHRASKKYEKERVAAKFDTR